MQCIDSWIRDRESGVRNVNVLESNAEVPIRTGLHRNVQTYPGLRGEVDAVRAVGNIVIGEKDAATQFEIRNGAMERREVVLQIEWREADAVRILLLADVVDRYEVNGIFQVPFWRLKQNSPQPKSRLKHSRIAASSSQAVSAGDEKFTFVRSAWDLILG